MSETTSTTGAGFQMTSPTGGRMPGHRIEWFVWASGPNGENRAKMRHTASMRGYWPGWDATCECGWSSHTGGAIKASVRRDVWNHKLDVHLLAGDA